LVDVLVVCTANVARSPLFAARLQFEADRRVGPRVVEVDSAGVEALFGEPAAGGAKVVCSRWGRSLDQHQATPVFHHDLAGLGLVLTMERAHRRDIVGREASLAGRTFTLRELVAIVSGRLPPSPVERLTGTDPAAIRDRILVVAALADQHRPVRLSRRRADVPDPIGAGQPVYDELGEEFTAAAATIAPLLFGPVRQ
jgi:protein-tyrosine phosphatase